MWDEVNRHRTRQLAGAVSADLGGDPLPVVTPEEMDAQKDLAGSIVRPAFLEGRVLYDRTA